MRSLPTLPLPISLAAEVIEPPTDVNAELLLDITDGTREIYITLFEGEIETYSYDGANYTSSAQALYNPIQHRWLRATLDDASNTVTFETSSDGQVWAEFDTLDSSILNLDELSLWVSAGVFSGVVMNPDLTRFDNVRVCGP
jgi:hypothetical protein